MNARALILAAALLTSAAPVRAETSLAPPSVHALSVEVGPTVYVTPARATIFAGPKLTLGYAIALAAPLWLELHLGLASGACLQRSDEKDCVLRPGTAVEPTVGLRAEARLGEHAVAFGALALGALALTTDSLPGGAGGIARAGGGVRRFVSPTVALGLDVTGGLALGRFQLDYAGSASALVNFEAALVLETRF